MSSRSAGGSSRPSRPSGSWGATHAAEALRAEHADLHRVLGRAARESGEVGHVARSMLGMVHRHFLAEEQGVLAILALIPDLVQGRLPRAAAGGAALVDRFQGEAAGLREQHRQIEVSLGELVVAAQRDNRPEYADFARRLRLHIQAEEEVLYPAALLVGEYLKAVRWA